MAVVRMPGMSDAESAVIVIWSTVELAADVAAARAINPGSHPIVPADFRAWLIRKALGDLVELGFEPEGWQDAYAKPLPGEDGMG